MKRTQDKFPCVLCGKDVTQPTLAHRKCWVSEDEKELNRIKDEERKRELQTWLNAIG
jgi:hypothetical protein